MEYEFLETVEFFFSQKGNGKPGGLKETKARE
jgi:hypothetical protein